MYDFKFPDVGEGITEAEIVKWNVKEGDKVKQDQPLGEVETDKAVVEMPSPKAGTIAKIHHKEGDTVKVGEVLVTIAEEGENVTDAKKEEPAAKKEVTKETSDENTPSKESSAAQTSSGGSDDHYSASVVGKLDDKEELIQRREVTQQKTTAHIQATPAVRRLARDMKVNLENVKGTGMNGRITEEDVRKAGGAGAEEPKTEADPSSTQKEAPKSTPKVIKKYDFYGFIDRMPLRGVRKATAKHMVESVSKIPHVVHMDEADVTELFDIREKEKGPAKEKGTHLTFMPFVVRAAVSALKEHPSLNASLDDEHEEIIIKKYYNIGVAVDAKDGLIVPVLKEADKKSILAISKEIEDLAKKADERKLDIADLKGGSFTITNIGAIGGLHATPIINYPEAAILATGRIYEKAVPMDGKIVTRRYLPFSVAFDHRILDGAECARFAEKFKSNLNNPELMLIGD